MTAARPPGRSARVTPFDDPEARFIAGRFGVWLFLVSLAMLFGASLIGFLVIRLKSGDAWPADFPPLPRVLWISTALLVLSSGTAQLALADARRGASGRCAAAISVTLLLGLAFLGMQVLAGALWLPTVTARWGGETDVARFALTSFYVLTGLHALHVIGGLIPMSIVTARAARGGYGPGRYAGIQYCVTYWHFLDGVWIVLFASLLLGT